MPSWLMRHFRCDECGHEMTLPAAGAEHRTRFGLGWGKYAERTGIWWLCPPCNAQAEEERALAAVRRRRSLVVGVELPARLGAGETLREEARDA